VARLARVVAVGVPHHITQRGNAQRFALQDEADRKVYLDLLRQSAELHGIALIGYCLMSNHVHLVAIPERADVLARALKETHGRFASYWNALHHSTGHVWQGRYYSCPLDEPHLWEALRYTELNPVRACLVNRAEGWDWFLSGRSLTTSLRPTGRRVLPPPLSPHELLRPCLLAYRYRRHFVPVDRRNKPATPQ
jgi:putative transposase